MGRFAALGNRLYTGETSLDIVGRRRLWYAVSAAILVLSLAGLLGRGLVLGLEFRGGSEFRVSQVASTSQSTGADAVRRVEPGAGATVSQVGGSGVRVQTDRLTDRQTDQVAVALARAYGVPTSRVTSSFVGPSWGADVSRKALTALVAFLVLVSAALAAYFRTWTMALAGIVALLHDLVITVGVYALLGFEVTPATVIGFLTILGYSLYDTVVVFDKVRENTQGITASTRRTYSEAANLAVNQTLVRSINTSVVGLLPVASVLVTGALFLGAGTLRDLSLALFVGITAGAYSSIFIATPLLAQLREREPAMRALAQRVRARRAGEAAGTRRPAAGGSGAAGGAHVIAAGGAHAIAGEAVTAGLVPEEPTRPRTSRPSGPRAQPRRPAAGRPSGKRRR